MGTTQLAIRTGWQKCQMRDSTKLKSRQVEIMPSDVILNWAKTDDVMWQLARFDSLRLLVKLRIMFTWHDFFLARFQLGKKNPDGQLSSSLSDGCGKHISSLN